MSPVTPGEGENREQRTQMRRYAHQVLLSGINTDTGQTEHCYSVARQPPSGNSGIDKVGGIRTAKHHFASLTLPDAKAVQAIVAKRAVVRCFRQSPRHARTRRTD